MKNMIMQIKTESIIDRLREVFCISGDKHENESLSDAIHKTLIDEYKTESWHIMFPVKDVKIRVVVDAFTKHYEGKYSMDDGDMIVEAIEVVEDILSDNNDFFVGGVNCLQSQVE
jgi:hypothetical protein